MSEVVLAELINQPWSWVGPTRISDPESGDYFELRIRELPAFLVAGKTRDETLGEAMDALEALLENYLERKEAPPLPAKRDVWRTGLRQVQSLVSKAADAAARTLGFTATL